MIFHAVRASNRTIGHLFTYACLNDGRFSFNLLSRSREFEAGEIEALIEDAVDAATPELEIEGMKITDGATYEECYPESTY